MAKVKLELNRPLEGALKYAKGKHYDSTIPGKAGSYMYSLTSGEVIFIDEDDCQEPDEMFANANVGAGDPFTITLRKRNGTRYFEVRNLNEPQPGPAPAAAAIEPRKSASVPTAHQHTSTPELPTAIDSTPMERMLTESINNVLRAQRALSAPAAPCSGGQSKNNTTTANCTPIAHTSYSRVMAGALIAAIDASREAARYAESVGFEIEFSTDDVRCLASTLFIQAAKDPAFLSQPVQKVNGGASWQQ